MICPECDGYKNFVSLAGTPFEVVKPCKRCNGTGEIEMTEQEYIQTCNTEQLAEVLFSWYKLGRLDVINKHTEVKKDWLKEWLKQPHTTKR